MRFRSVLVRARPPVLVTLIAFAASACASSQGVTPATVGSSPEARQQVNEELAGRSAWVMLRQDCQVLRVQNAQLLGDTLYYTDPDEQRRMDVAVEDVVRITAHSGGGGAKRGALIGLVIWGGITGAAVVASLGQGQGTGDGPPGIVGAVIVGLLAAPIIPLAALLGGPGGDERRYEFDGSECLVGRTG